MGLGFVSTWFRDLGVIQAWFRPCLGLVQGLSKLLWSLRGVFRQVFTDSAL
jgi:hypothetical protein